GPPGFGCVCGLSGPVFLVARWGWRARVGGARRAAAPLRTFRELVAADGFTAAADRLGVTQSAVSHKIRRLEERLGLDLVRRDGQRIVLTVEGRDLLDHAEAIVDAHDRAVDSLQRSTVSGTVRLGCNEEVAATQLAEVASRFRRTHPEVALEIRVRDSAVVSRWLDDGEVDVALIQVLDTDDALRGDDEVWRRDELMVVQADGADFDSVDEVPLISFGPDCLYEPWFASAMADAGTAWRTVMECPSIQGVQAAVAAGVGVAVLNTPHVTAEMRPYGGLGGRPLPPVAFVLRAAVDAGTDDAIDALRAHLTTTLDPGVPA
ncbi:MAG: LysR family transcriptional regulator, partial [Actinomycetota bacterium]